MVVEVAGAVGKAVGVITTKLPVPAAGAAPLADDKVGVLVE